MATENDSQDQTSDPAREVGRLQTARARLGKRIRQKRENIAETMEEIEKRNAKTDKPK